MMSSQTFTAYAQDKHPTAKRSAMLLPTKVAEIRGVNQSYNDVGMHDQDKSYVPFPHGSSSRWTAQPVLNWVESLATAATTSLSADDAAAHGSKATVKILDELSDATQANVVGNIHLLDQKRSSTPPLLDESNDNGYVTCQWDLSFVDKHDPCAYLHTRKMKHLAGNFEKMMTTAKTTKKFQDMSLAYQMVQSRFNFTFDRIVWQNLNRHQTSHSPESMSSEVTHGNIYQVDSEYRLLLDALYAEICQKLQNITSAFAKDTKVLGSIQSPATIVSQTNCANVQVKAHQDLSKSMKKHQTKQELGKYMTSWLRANFTNPYPDDEGLVQMAKHCGTTNQVISNWLINARTRKWRPAIIKATELGRPADMLLEDSINIFDGKPVRRIADALTTEAKTASSMPSRPSMITPIRPDIPGSIHDLNHKSIKGIRMENDIHLGRVPAMKRHKRLHVVTTPSSISNSSLPRATTTNQNGVGPWAPKAFPGSHAAAAATMHASHAPKLIFDDEDDDGILLQSIQNAIDMESMSDDAVTFDTDFFPSTNAEDEETIDVDALSPTFFNITNLHQALSHYTF